MRHTGSMIMTGDRQAEITVRAAREGGRLIRAVHLLSWGLLAALTGGAFLLAGWQTAQSVLIGGLLVNGSFYFLQRDIRQLLRKVSQEGMDFKTVKKLEKVRFILKFYLRLIVLGLVLFVLVQRLHVRLHMVGLVIGLSTVMLSNVAVAAGNLRRLGDLQSCKGV